MEFVTSFIPHILFVISQSFCGASLALLVGPLFLYVWSGQYSYTELLAAFPVYWRITLLDDLSFYKLLLLGGVFFALGMLYAEFCYRVGRKIGYHRDLGLHRDPRRDANETEQIDQFEWKIRMLKYPHLHRIWEWENFQTSFFLYAEYVMLLFCPAYVICLVISALQGGGAANNVAIIVLVGILALVIYWAMRKARIEKYRSFSLAQRAVENVYREEAMDRTEKVKDRKSRSAGDDEHEGEVTGRSKRHQNSD